MTHVDGYSRNLHVFPWWDAVRHVEEAKNIVIHSAKTIFTLSSTVQNSTKSFRLHASLWIRTLFAPVAANIAKFDARLREGIIWVMLGEVYIRFVDNRKLWS